MDPAGFGYYYYGPEPYVSQRTSCQDTSLHGGSETPPVPRPALSAQPEPSALSVPRNTEQGKTYSYRVKIINPKRKSDAVIRTLHHLHHKFKSVTEIKVALMEGFGEQVPPTTNFKIGYFSGRQSQKNWIMCQDDIAEMYQRITSDDIVLWCDARVDDGNAPAGQPKAKKNRKEEGNNEDRVDALVDKLCKQHESAYSMPQYRLWARMMVSGVHNSEDTPPNVPAITGVTPKRPKKEPISTALVGAANAIVDAIRSPDMGRKTPPIQPHLNTATASLGPGMSPGKIAELRLKGMEQLKSLQQLHEDGVLSLSEFEEQKKIVLDGLRKLK